SPRASLISTGQGLDHRRLLQLARRVGAGVGMEGLHANGGVQGVHAQGAPRLMQAVKPAVVHDVVVIGSGAAGGMAAWNLSRQGVNVLLLDAGTRFNPATYW